MAEFFQRPATVAAALMQRAAAQPDQPALRFINGPDDVETVSYGELDRRARAIAAVLQRLGAGARAVLLLPSGPDYVASFFGCLYAGVIAVPAYPPESTREQHLQRLLSIIADAEPGAILTVSALAQLLPDTLRHNHAFPDVLAVDTFDTELAQSWRGVEPSPQQIAFLQYTSGSTSTPKGVQVSHANLEANEWLIRQGYGIGDNDVLVSWLPLYHDMGLIGGLLQGIYSGIPVVLMSPPYFLERPLRWLEAIATFGGTISGGPDFAYRLCFERIAESKIAGLDLSSWRIAFSGAEPIRQDSLNAFAEKFSVCGFRADAFLASYGLAEATLFVTGGRPGRGIDALRIDAQALAANRVVRGDGATVMSCGFAQPDHAWMIVDAHSGAILADDQVGEVWTCGPSIALGYWRRPEATAAAFVEREGRTWLRTGDLGFRHDEALFVTGRIKDMLIVRGQNLYPQDVERTVETAVEAVRKGRVAAFGIQHEGSERLAIAAEIGRKAGASTEPEALIARIRAAVAEAHQESPCAVILLNPGALPKTSSGKLQRSACRAQLEAGTLDSVAIYREGQSKPTKMVATQSVAEQVATLWRQLLKTDVIAPDAGFFALGGNSILAIQMIAELRDELQVALELRDLFEAQTLAAFTELVEAQLATQSGIERIARVTDDRALPQSPAQNRLWLLWQLAPDSAAYHIPGGLRLRGDLDETALRAGFEILVQRHEALRTTFFERDGQGFQRIHEPGEWFWQYDDLRALASADREQHADAIRAQEAHAPFDLQHGPLLRVRLVALDDLDHLLLVTLHHIIADGWSLGILLDELAQLYSGAVQGQAVQLPPLPIRYADYAAWSCAQQDNAALAGQLDYWRTELGEPCERLSLPLDRPDTGAAAPAERLSLRLEKSLCARLQIVARAQNSTLFTLLLSAFQVLLQGCCGQSDIRVGVPHANRRHRETQRLVGFFINTQVLRSVVDTRLSFAELLAGASTTVQRAHAHQDIDFERVSAALAGGIDTPLFDVMFNHQQRDLGALRRLPGLLAEELPWHSREAKFALQMHSEQDAQGNIRLSFDYSSAVFERASIDNIARRLLCILEQICADPERRVDAFELLTEDERIQQRAWGANPVAGAQALLPGLLAAQAGSSALSVALIHAGGRVRYAELDRRANALAWHLRAYGVGPDVCVGISAERSLERLIVLLAIVKAGGAYVPLDPEYPRERLNAMIGDSGLSLLLGRSALLAELDVPAALTRIAFEQLDLARQEETPPDLLLHRDHLAYVIFTSGSTGRPKGVGISHGALAERLHWMRAQYGIGADDVLLQKAPLGFDVSVWECFLPLISGARLVLAAEGEQRDPRRIAELVREHGVTTVHFVPALLQAFIDEPDSGHCTSLRRLFAGGEVLPATLCRALRERLPQVELHNRYGPTETAINVTHWFCSDAERSEGATRVPIGRPLGNVVCELRDGGMELAPTGARAELLLGGSGLARGYIGAPARTAERFIPAENGERFYRSGDWARWRHDGVLEYLGRIDEQIKLRGFRIEPEEIRHCLLRQSGVRAAAVLLCDSEAGPRLVAYVCAADTARDNEFGERLKTALQAQLPDYMVPAFFVFLEQLPLLPSGKLDQRALPEPEWRTRDYIAPSAPHELRLAAIWCEVLGRDRISQNDDFFELGGHSLLATRIVSRTRQAFDIELPLRSLFENRRFDAYAALVAQLCTQGVRDSHGEITPVDRSQRIALSYSQQRMWFLWQLDPHSPAYNVGGAAVLRGPLRPDVFERALRALIQRHETLRTTFPSEQGRPFQQVAADPGVRMSQLDFSQLPDALREERLQAEAGQQAHAPFDLEHGPLLRVCLIKTAEQEHHLLVALHHIVTEGWAMDIFARELAALYAAFLDGRESPLAPLPVQYLDYSVWQRRWLEGGELQRQLAYWREQLGGEQPLLALPTDFPRPPEQSYRGDLFRFDIDAALSARVRAFSAERGITLFMMMSAALAALLYRHSGQNDLRIGVPVANRIRPESEGLIGAFLNTQVLRVQPEGRMSGAALLAQVRQVAIEAQSHQDVPFDLLVDALQPERSAAYNPLFQVMCNVQRWEFQQSRVIADDLRVEYRVNDARATKFDLNLEVTDIDEQLRCCFTYSTDLFERTTIERLARHWRNLLDALVQNPDAPLCELALMDADEYRATIQQDAAQALLEHAAPDAPFTVQALFEQQVRRAPDALALTIRGESLSYAQLNTRANQLAHRLRAAGIGPEQRVGLALPRSFDLVIGLLAILKAGAAYVPLDPEYPSERLRYLIEDSGVTLLLAHGDLADGLALASESVPVWDLARADYVPGAGNEANPEPVNAPEHLAYLIYTSGSTGRPKGVAVNHTALAMHCRATGELFGTRPDDNELHLYSINFDAASERLLVPLLFGARVVLREQGQWDAQVLCDVIRTEKVNVLGFTPSYGRQLAQWLSARGEHWPVRLCITGGEALLPEHVRDIDNAFAPTEFFNAYGPTETVVMPLAHRVLRDAPGAIPIGRAVGARNLYVLDADLTPVPVGVSGELFVGGAGMARGYHARPGLSAERFVADPFSTTGGRLYRTGDRVRRRPDGTFDYLGRIDQQVKIRGFRIEPGEIEARLQTHPDVRECVVLAVEGPSSTQLAAYVASAHDGDEQNWRDGLQAHLRAELPDHMVPAFFIRLAQLPLTANGKLDRAALPAPDLRRGDYQAPRSDTEQRLAAIWCAVLNVQRIGIDDNFFELGGDSILSIQVVSRARQQGLHFTARDLFRHQTIRALAAAVGCGRGPLAEQGAVLGASLLTPIQQWFFELGAARPQHWNQSLLLAPRSALQVEPLRRALLCLLEHHDALRQRFVRDEENTPWQAQYQSFDSAQDVLWLHDADDTQARQAVFDTAQRSLDLTHGPLLRAVLTQGKEQRLLLIAHHLVVDGVSWRILLEDLQHLYNAFAQGRDNVALPAKTHAQRDWAARLQAYAGSESLREELRWWQTQLADAPAEIPRDFHEGDIDKREDDIDENNREKYACHLSLRLPAADTRILLERTQTVYRTGIADVLLIALARVLCRWTGDNSALIEVEGHGREEALFDDIDLSRSVGWFTSTYPLKLTPAPDLEQSVRLIKEQLRALPHKGLGYGVLRYLADAQSRAVMRALPRARVTFNYLGQIDQAAAIDAPWQWLDEAGGDRHDGDTPLPNWLGIDSQVSGGELVLRWTFSERLFERATIESRLEDFREELAALVELCRSDRAVGTTPADFPLARLSREQLDTLPVPLPAIEDIYPLTPMQEGLLLHTLLEPGTGLYFMQDRYRINSALDAALFDQAWRKVVARHEALRASFCWDSSDNMLQIIHRDVPEGVEFLDWSTLPEDQHEQRLQGLLKEEREAGFDLLARPPFRLRLIRLAPDRHWFIMSNHHILIDAWCRSLLMGDFLEIYAALEAGTEAQLDTPPRYRDFIAWLHAQGLSASREWWQRQLAGFERPSFLPSDRPFLRDRNNNLPVADRHARLCAEQSSRLRELAQRQQLTVNTFAQAAWALVLLRYGRERDVVFGVTVAGRPASLPAMQNTVGLFINTVPLRVTMPAPGQPQRVGQWLRDLLERNLELREHEHVPLVQIQECSELAKGQPLFDSLFVFENAPVEQGVLDRARGLNASSDSGRTHTNYPLTVVCYPGDELGLHLSYDQRFFDASTIERLLADFKRLLLALVEHFDGDWADLPLLTDGERRWLLEDCNRTGREYPLYDGYIPLFEARVRAHPQRVAARCLDRAWTYAELDRGANRLGHALIAAGVRPDQPVALLGERDLPLLGMIVGSFKAGAGYVPLDPSHPEQRLTRILNMSGAAVLVCSASCRDLAVLLLEACPESTRPTLLVWDDVQQGAGDDRAPNIRVGGGHLAYVIYTSGSTGLPKGVAVEQAGMLNNQLSKLPYLQLSEHDVIAQTASQGFDISVWQFLTAPLCGARVEIVPDTIAHDPAALLRHVRATGITVLESVPALIQGMLVEESGALDSLRCLLPTGEAMPPEVARMWLQRYPAIPLINAYGPAECSDDVALFTVDEAATLGSYLPIGSATDNNRLYLLDGDLQPVPPGAVGELYIAGIGVGRGYIGDRARTALSFLPCPFDESGARWYRSGDLARRRGDGVLEYVGRVDHQIKIRGYRIELGEIEARLYAHAEVRDAAVAVQESAIGKYLVGYVVPAEGMSPAPDGGEYRAALEQHLRLTLPDYMLPSHWHWLERLPRNSNGKLDRNALPAIQFDRAQGVYEAPRTELERELAAIWSDVLKVERVGINDDFLALGGHSLLAAQIAARAQRTLRRSVPLRAMFECSTVAQLASRIEAAADTALTEQKTSRIDDLMSRLEAT